MNPKNIVILGAPSFVVSRLTVLESVSIIQIHDLLHWSLNGVALPNTPGTSIWALQRLPIAVEKIRNLGPVISRHLDDQPGMELHLRTLGLQIVALAESLWKNNFSYAIQFTSVSHWLDSFILEIACELAGVKQIFLYATIFEGRLLPMIQHAGIQTRRPLGIEVSNHVLAESFELDIYNYRTRLFSSEQKNIKNYRVAQILIFKSYFRNYLGRIKRRIFKRQVRDHFPRDMRVFNLRSDLHALRRHQDGLIQLRKYQSEDAPTINLYLAKLEAPAICIFAHFQPEATTFPEGGKFSNYVDLVAHIRSLGYSQPIFYREHPTSYVLATNYSLRQGIARSGSFYEQMRSMGCIFLSEGNLFEESPHLIPATIAGSIAIERSLRGLTTLVDGVPYFSRMPGIISSEEYILKSDLKLGLGSINQQYEAKSYFKELINFKSVGNPFGIAGYPFDFSDTSRKEEATTEFMNLVHALSFADI